MEHASQKNKLQKRNANIIKVVGVCIVAIALFVAGFMGSPQMNFLDAKIAEKGGELVANIGEHR